MRLDVDCIRDILLQVEELSGYNQSAIIHYSLENAEPEYFEFMDSDDCEEFPEEEFPISSLFEEYSPDVVFYHVDYCYKANLIEEPAYFGLYHAEIPDLTAYGHEFLANIRDTRNWSAIKKGLSAVRNYSLATIQAIATGVTQGAISSYLISVQ